MELKTKMITLRIEPGLYNPLLKMANQNRRSLSDMVRQIIFDATEGKNLKGDIIK